jgi:nucleolar GTP-binding protein
LCSPKTPPSPPPPSPIDFIDIVLSKTQRKTPTVCHKDWFIQRLREFYARKIKFTASSFDEKLTQILDGFPRLDDIHPYYANLINVLYSKHHYKLALGQLSTARTLIDNLAKDYLRSIKFADTQYRCKELKRAALGRMATIAKKLSTSLAYLERVRQHLSRLPAINPNTRTIMVTGFPNVGKSSFMNHVSRADVDVQPFAFTTKSIFVGHFYYQDQPWQVLDTPGILDHSLEERNIIEMQAITALAYLQSTIMFFIDISETCGHTIEKQVQLYHNIKDLFANKPLLVVCTKTDLKDPKDLSAEDQALIEQVAKDRDTTICYMSNQTTEGVSKVKALACELSLKQRCEQSLQTGKVEKVANRLNVAVPQRRDNVKRVAQIPEAVKQRQEEERQRKSELTREYQQAGLLDNDAIKQAIKQEIRESRPVPVTLHDLEEQWDGPGRFTYDHRNYLDLKEEDWKFDIIPEFMDGKNVADFYDEDIMERLAELEEEEEELQRAFEESGLELELEQDELTEEQTILLEKIRNKKGVMRSNNRLKQGIGIGRGMAVARKYLPKTMEQAKAHLESMGLESGKYEKMVGVNYLRKTEMDELSKAQDNDQRNVHNKRTRKSMGDDGMEDDEGLEKQQRKSPLHPILQQSIHKDKLERMADHKSRALTQSRMRGTAPELGQGFRDNAAKEKAEKLEKREWKRQIEYARVGESDRRYVEEMPKHIYRDKRGLGTYRR